MKPLNLDNSPCTPISSNCVIWQGPSIPCIKLCTGDTVSDVVFKLATELCTILDQLNVSNYDLACLNLGGCDPKDFQALVQLLITKICELETIPVPPPTPDGTGCPTDCIVSTKGCLIGPDEPDGEDTLINYVDTIATKVCNLIDEISIIQNTITTIKGPGWAGENLVSLQNQIDSIVTNPFTLPQVQLPNGCTIGIYTGPIVDPPTLDVMFNQFISDWCTFRGVVGTNAELQASVLSQCITSTDTALEFQYSLTAPANQLGVYYSGTWVDSPATVADAINNIWIALCDVRNAGKTLSAVAAGTNVTVTSAVAVVGNNQVTTYTVNAVLPDILNEGVLLTANPASIDFVGDLVTATTAGDNITVNINSLGGMYAQQTPSNLNSVPFALGTTLFGQANQPIAVIYDDDLTAYNPATGVWTCPATGRYNISCYAHYTRDTGDGWYDSLNPGGMFGIGIFDSTGSGVYCADYVTIMGAQKHIDVSSQIIGVQLTAAISTIAVKVINQTGYNYTSVVGDDIRLSIQRIK